MRTLESFRAEQTAAEAVHDVAKQAEEQAIRDAEQAAVVARIAAAATTKALNAVGAAAARTPIHALRAGTVVSAGPRAHGDLAAVVEGLGEDGKPMQIHYGKLRAVYVEEGEVVKVDDLIGWM